jgi:hypothetical protein
VTFYVNHVSAEIPWSTKETPDNPSTKGSIKFKRCKLSIDTADNTATISKLGIVDAWLKHPERRAGRIIVARGTGMFKALKAKEFEHSKMKEVIGSCGSSWIICDIRDEHDLTMAGLKYAGQFRILAPNETYYQEYDTKDYIYEDEELYESDDDD